MIDILPKFANDRLDICKKCDDLVELNRCSVCGCFMNAKVLLPFASCPKNKWDTEEL